MPLVIPIQAVPSQTVNCVLGGQNCQIAVYYKVQGIFVDLAINGADVFVASLGLNQNPLDPCNSYDGFAGDLYFIDTQGSDDPQYTGFGTRWFLLYLTAAEIESISFRPVTSGSLIQLKIMTLSATLNVTSSEPGNFSVAHGLETVPFLIEILPTSGGAIWAQSGFADETNINLVASDADVTATILVFTTAAAGLTTQTPAATIPASSVAPGNFSVAHGLGVEPEMIELLPSSAGALWLQDPPFDATNVYLTASASGVTATISAYKPPISGAFNLVGPATTLGVTSGAPGNFNVAHGLTTAPSRVEILMISGGAIWAQAPAFDGTNVYLTASDIGVVAKILVYA